MKHLYILTLSLLMGLTACKVQDKGHTQSQTESSPADKRPEIAKQPKPAPQEELKGTLEEQFIQLLNRHRAATGKNKVEKDTLLDRLARNHSYDMGTERGLGHNGFDKRTDTFGRGYGYAENVSNFSAPASGAALKAFDIWLNSSVHKRNMEGEYNKAGVGFVLFGENEYYVTLMLADTRLK